MILPNFLKLHEIEKILGRRGRPLGTATGTADKM